MWLFGGGPMCSFNQSINMIYFATGLQVSLNTDTDTLYSNYCSQQDFVAMLPVFISSAQNWSLPERSSLIRKKVSLRSACVCSVGRQRDLRTGTVGARLPSAELAWWKIQALLRQAVASERILDFRRISSYKCGTTGEFVEHWVEVLDVLLPQSFGRPTFFLASMRYSSVSRVGDSGSIFCPDRSARFLKITRISDGSGSFLSSGWASGSKSRYDWGRIVLGGIL